MEIKCIKYLNWKWYLNLLISKRLIRKSALNLELARHNIFLVWPLGLWLWRRYAHVVKFEVILIWHLTHTVTNKFRTEQTQTSVIHADLNAQQLIEFQIQDVADSQNETCLLLSPHLSPVQWTHRQRPVSTCRRPTHPNSRISLGLRRPATWPCQCHERSPVQPFESSLDQQHSRPANTRRCAVLHVLLRCSLLLWLTHSNLMDMRLLPRNRAKCELSLNSVQLFNSSRRHDQCERWG